jgi:hypothetical protein
MKSSPFAFTPVRGVTSAFFVPVDHPLHHLDETMKWTVRSGLKSLLWLVGCAGLVVRQRKKIPGAQAGYDSGFLDEQLVRNYFGPSGPTCESSHPGATAPVQNPLGRTTSRTDYAYGQGSQGRLCAPSPLPSRGSLTLLSLTATSSLFRHRSRYWMEITIRRPSRNINTTYPGMSPLQRLLCGQLPMVEHE